MWQCWTNIHTIRHHFATSQTNDKNLMFLHPEKKETIVFWRIFWAGFLLKENGLAFMRHDCYEREKKIDGIILVPRNDFIRREEMKMGLKNIQLCRYYLHIKNVGCQHFSLFLHFYVCSSCFLDLCFVRHIFSFFGFWYFGHFSYVISSLFFPSCSSCLAKM